MSQNLCELGLDPECMHKIRLYGMQPDCPRGLSLWFYTKTMATMRYLYQNKVPILAAN